MSSSEYIFVHLGFILEMNDEPVRGMTLFIRDYPADTPISPTSDKLVISGLLGCSGSDARPVTRGLTELTESTGRARLSSHHFHRPPRFPQAPGVNILPTMWEIIAEK